MDRGDLGGPGASNSSSDFVRKLYKMLEDPSYESVVRWGNEGDSFVVLENEKFTKSILPKHFKHSNFASFVRQLNKYDFHKVRQSNEENGQSPYGQGAWEFKHPEFQANRKDSLDNIRRKAPAPRKPNQPLEDTFPAQQIDLVNSQLVATQHQLQHLQERYNDLANGHVVLLQQVVQLQKIVKNHDGVMHRVMGFLHGVDAQRRGSRGSSGPFTNGTSTGMGIADLVAPTVPDDQPASPLQQASLLLGEFNAENLINKDLEQMTAEFTYRNEYSTPPNDHGTSSLGPTSGVSSGHMAYASLSSDLDNMVYPVGQTNGIDPINSEHIHNIPYSLPPNGVIPTDSQNAALSKTGSGDRKRSVADPGWGPRKPRVLLVEDDKTCARIGCKFLQTFECGVETARDGLEAVNKINSGGPNAFDLILMDIIMPNLDGVSATVCIREIAPTIPIVAMTSNIRTDDIDMYFRYGMNDVLPKPFTKEGMLRTLEKHLFQFKKGYINPPSAQQSGSYAVSNSTSAPMNLNMALSSSQSLKDESSPGRSPASSWHSPSQIGQSPITNSSGTFLPSMTGSVSYPLTPTNPHGTFAPVNAPMQSGRPPHRRVVSDLSDITNHDDHPEKRQRMYPPQTGYTQ